MKAFKNPIRGCKDVIYYKPALKKVKSWVWWYMTVIPECRELRKEGCNVKTISGNFSNIMKFCLNKK